MGGAFGELAYPLQLPRLYSYLVMGTVTGVALCGLAADVSDAAAVLTGLLAWRTWCLAGRFEKSYRGAILQCKCTGRLDIVAFGHRDYVALAWDPPRRFPGFIAVRFQECDGKPLEILIFCRYDQRRSYRRLILHLMYHHD